MDLLVGLLFFVVVIVVMINMGYRDLRPEGGWRVRDFVMKEEKITLNDIKALDGRHGFVIGFPFGLNMNPDLPEKINQKIVEGQWASKELSFYTKVDWQNWQVLVCVFPPDTQFDSGLFYKSFAGSLGSPVRVDTLTAFIRSIT